MKAVVYQKYGHPEVLQLKEVEKPIPKDNEVLIKTHATTVNRTDNATIKAIPFLGLFNDFIKHRKTWF
jgi:NADPH:quinone reductase-like Zn-dependent oxidoreductase